MEIAHRFLTYQHFPSPRTIKFLQSSSLDLGLGFLRSLHCRTTMSSSSLSLIQVKEKIDLSEKETQIFERLMGVVRHFSLTNNSLMKETQLRVAGGWVRDKLLGKECYDIDIALDNMLGREFCEKVNEYFSHIGEANQGIGVIQSNPDQSKHLETARMRLYDVWIDFVNLRSEDYSENSRIPTMKFGTAEEDAYRRDLTINSLFYNINTDSVEDFTGRGVDDLKAGKIVTPLPPKETFLDDPLRVLRAIHFGARFGFVLDDELKKAAADDDVNVAIRDKISRERIGHEIDLMISGNEPVKAVAYICDFRLFWVVFTPPQAETSNIEECDRHCVAYIEAAWRLLHVVGFSTFSDEERRLYLYGALFLPLRKSLYADNKGKKLPIVNHIFRNSLKLKSSDAETVMKLHEAAQKFLSLIPSLTSNNLDHVEEDQERIKRISAGKLLREIKSFWRTSLLISILMSRGKEFPKECAELDKSKQLYRSVEKAVMELGLDKVWEQKPLVNGKEIISILQLKTGGPQVKKWQDRLLEWQLGHPNGIAEECLDWMRQELDESSNATVQEQEPVAEKI
ncbi:CCA tRNA nucleotidyltransferase [Ranunculus cassubicifolius]